MSYSRGDLFLLASPYKTNHVQLNTVWINTVVRNVGHSLTSLSLITSDFVPFVNMSISRNDDNNSAHIVFQENQLLQCVSFTCCRIGIRRGFAVRSNVVFNSLILQ